MRPLPWLGLVLGAVSSCTPSAPTAHKASTTAPLHPLTATDEGSTTTSTTEPEPEPEPTTTVVTINNMPATTRRGTTTTTFRMPEAETDEDDETWWAGQPGLPVPPDYIKQCESGGDYTAVNRSSGAGGAWQFLPSTWRSVGGTGLPQHASPAEQDYRAAILWDNGRGASHWDCA